MSEFLSNNPFNRPTTPTPNGVHGQNAAKPDTSATTPSESAAVSPEAPLSPEAVLSLMSQQADLAKFKLQNSKQPDSSASALLKNPSVAEAFLSHVTNPGIEHSVSAGMPPGLTPELVANLHQQFSTELAPILAIRGIAIDSQKGQALLNTILDQYLEKRFLAEPQITLSA